MNREEKRNTILKAATDVFAEAGIHKATLGDVARRAGMAKTSLYYYFKDREDLVNTALHDEQLRFMDMISSVVGQQDTVETKIFALMEAYYHLISHRARWIPREIMVEYRPPSSMVRLDKNHYLPPLKDLIERIMREIGRASCRERVYHPV